MNFKKTLLFLASGLILISCGDDEVRSPKFKHIENLNMDNIRNVSTILESPTAYSGKNICHVDSGKSYGVIYDYLVPDSLVGKQLAVSIDAWVRTGDVANNCGIVCSITDKKDSVIFWLNTQANDVITTPNEWVNMKSTITIPSDVTSRTDIKISIMPVNVNAKSYFDVDNLLLTYFEIE